MVRLTYLHLAHPYKKGIAMDFFVCVNFCNRSERYACVVRLDLLKILCYKNTNGISPNANGFRPRILKHNWLCVWKTVANYQSS